MVDNVRALPHLEVLCMHKFQILEKAKGKILRVAKDNTLEKASQPKFRVAMAKGGVKKVARVTSRESMISCGGRFTAVFNSPTSL